MIVELRHFNHPSAYWIGSDVAKESPDTMNDTGPLPQPPLSTRNPVDEDTPGQKPARKQKRNRQKEHTTEENTTKHTMELPMIPPSQDPDPLPNPPHPISAPVQNSKQTMKCVIVGDRDTEKTTLCISYTTNKFPIAMGFVPTVSCTIAK